MSQPKLTVRPEPPQTKPFATVHTSAGQVVVTGKLLVELCLEHQRLVARVAELETRLAELGQHEEGP